MKRKLSLLVLVAVCLAFTAGILCACNQDDVEFKDAVSVRFFVDGREYYEINGGGVAGYFENLTAKSKEIAWPENPVKDGYTFEGWYLSFDDGKTLTSDFTAKECAAFLESSSGKNLNVYARLKSTENPVHLVRFFDNDGNVVDSLNVSDGRLVYDFLPDRDYASDSEDAYFVGWAQDPEDADTAWSFDTEKVIDDVDLYPLILPESEIKQTAVAADENFKKSGTGYYYETYDEYYPIFSEFSAVTVENGKETAALWAQFSVKDAYGANALKPVVVNEEGQEEIVDEAEIGTAVGYVLPLAEGENDFTVQMFSYNGIVSETLDITVTRLRKEVSVVFDIYGDGSKYQIFKGIEGETLDDYPAEPAIDGKEFLGWEIRDEDDSYLRGEVFDPETDVIGADCGVIKAVFASDTEYKAVFVETDRQEQTFDSRLIEKGTVIPMPDADYAIGWEADYAIGWEDELGRQAAVLLKDQASDKAAYDDTYASFVLERVEGGAEFAESWFLPDNDNGEIIFNVYLQRFFDVEYVSDGGITSKGYSVYDRTEGLTLPGADSVYKTGYEFTGWYNGQTLVEVIEAGSTGDIELTAKWKVINYKITYIANGGNGRLPDDEYNIESSDIVLPDLTKDNYDFIGWYDAAGNEVDEIASGSVGDIVLFAKWIAKSYKISYLTDGGSNSAENPETYTVEDGTIVLKDPVRRGYTFLGWYESADFSADGRVYEIASGSTGRKYLYAKWEAITYYVAYIYNYDVPPTYESFTVEDGGIVPETLVREGYTFLGWYENPLCTGTPVDIVETDRSVILFAEWKKNEAAVF